jgi:hypothetical protein
MKRIHHYHADGSALGGIITLPKSAFIPSQAEVSLAPSGGSTSDKTGLFHFDDIVSCSGTETHASGSENRETGSWATLVTTVVTDLNIRNTVIAERVVAQISVEHPPEGYTPKVTFVGSQFVNLSIGGVPVEVIINNRILSPVADYPTVPWPKNKDFLDTIREQRRRVSKSGPTPDWAGGLFTNDDPLKGFDQKGYYLCSLVDRIEAKIPGKSIPGESCGHLVKVPDVGTFVFGELAVDHGSFRLVMVRAELGSPVCGSVSAAASRGNGYSGP